MTTDASPGFDARSLIPRIESGEVPREFVLHAARGFLPIEQEDLVAILAYLAAGADEEIAEFARQSLSDLPPRVVLAFARNESAEPQHLHYLATAASDAATLETILRNRAVDDATIRDLAARVGPHLQEVIVINQERILRSPGILDALLANPSLSGDIRRRALEVREEFFEKSKRKKTTVAAPGLDVREAAVEEDLSAIADLLEKAKAQDGPAVETLQATATGNLDEDSVFVQIVNMTAGERVQFAYKGGRTARGILIRDRNKIVCTAVLRSPRVTESEIEQFAAMRNVDDDVLRQIGMNREWMSKYGIVTALLRNPKAPLGVVLPLINRLTLRDLKTLTVDKNVSEGVRASAGRLYKSKKQG